MRLSLLWGCPNKLHANAPALKRALVDVCRDIRDDGLCWCIDPESTKHDVPCTQARKVYKEIEHGT